MPGWSEVQREGATVCVSPDCEEFDAIECAHQAFSIANASGGSLREVTKVLAKMKEFESEEDPRPTVDGLAQGKFRGAVLSRRAASRVSHEAGRSVENGHSDAAGLGARRSRGERSGSVGPAGAFWGRWRA